MQKHAFRTHADSEGPDQPVHLGILILAFTVLLQKCMYNKGLYQDPVVQSIISLMSSLVVRLLTVLVSTTSNSQVFLLKKYE